MQLYCLWVKTFSSQHHLGWEVVIEIYSSETVEKTVVGGRCMYTQRLWNLRRGKKGLRILLSMNSFFVAGPNVSPFIHLSIQPTVALRASLCKWCKQGMKAATLGQYCPYPHGDTSWQVLFSALTASHLYRAITQGQFVNSTEKIWVWVWRPNADQEEKRRVLEAAAG